MSANPNNPLLERIQGLKQIPTIPAVLAPLLRYLEQPAEDPLVQNVTDINAQDKALAAKCLQMAYRPFYGRWKMVSSLPTAILVFGFQRCSAFPMSWGVLSESAHFRTPFSC